MQMQDGILKITVSFDHWCRMQKEDRIRRINKRLRGEADTSCDTSNQTQPGISSTQT